MITVRIKCKKCNLRANCLHFTFKATFNTYISKKLIKIGYNNNEQQQQQEQVNEQQQEQTMNSKKQHS